MEQQNIYKVPKCTAFKLGAGSPKAQELIKEGKIVKHTESYGSYYELISPESKSIQCQLALPGYYCKIDQTGSLSSVLPGEFESNHVHIDGCTYHQVSTPVEA